MILLYIICYLFNFSYAFENSLSLHNQYSSLEGRVLYPGLNGRKWWDSKNLGGPVVLPPNNKRKKWLMYYYGRDSLFWNYNITADPYFPTGYIGLVESIDGLHWKSIKGNYHKGRIMQPTNDNMSYDNIQIGVSDVIEKNDNTFIMHYFGGTEEKLEKINIGLRMRCLTADSHDGKNWFKYSFPIIDVGKKNEWDNIFTTCPRVIPVDPDNLDGKWLITYHSLMFDNYSKPIFKIGVGITNNKYGLGSVTKKGIILEPGKKGSWDEECVSTRHVIHYNNSMYMFYEGMKEGVWAIGLAYSNDKGNTWHKLRIKGKKDPGGPIFEARYNNKNAWDNYGVECPWIVKKQNGELRMYYLGIGSTKEGNLTTAIGCADCINNDLTKWKRVYVRKRPEITRTQEYYDFEYIRC